MKLKIFTFFFLLITAPAALAQGAEFKTFNKWVAFSNDDETIFYAMTINDSDSVLTFSCMPETNKCIFTLKMTTACEEGADYPAMSNTSGGAQHIMLVCAGQEKDKKYSYIFKDYDLMIKVLEKATKLGIAFPLQDDVFNVVRFDLIGSEDAIQLTAARSIEKRKSSTKDIKL